MSCTPRVVGYDELTRASVLHSPSLTLAPRISLSGARAAYFGPGLDLAPHRNAAATVALALETPFALSLPAESAPETRAIALIPPDTRHRLVATGPMVFLYLAALSDDHRRLANANADLDAAYARTMQSGASAVATWDVDRLCTELGVPPRATPDPRVAAAVRLLEAHPQDFPHVGPLAARVGLSPSRFHALFGRAVGMPFRRYRQWRRMAVVMRALSEGSSLTEAAYEAGFASSAHLSATFRDMFGLTPSALVALGVRIELGEGSDLPRLARESD